MQKRHARFTVMALLLACGLTAAYFLWTIEQRTSRSVATQASISGRLDHMRDTVAGIGAAQQSYVAPGQLDAPWFERTSMLIDELSTDIEQARAILRSSQASEALEALAASTEALITADARTRQNLRLGQELMASDVIFSDGHNILDAMIARVRDLGTAEDEAHRADLSTLSRQRWMALTATALLWMTGLLALVTIPASTSVPSAAPQLTETRAQADPLAEQPPPVEPRPSVDLASAARLCTDLSRVTSTAALPDLLGRAARVLDASGVILWMSAGEQLFPVMGHGYRQNTLARLGPISGDAENAAADAWRTAQLTVVGAPGPAGTGAIVAPLFGLHACIGVLSAEFRHGAEYNPATQAVATMIAAQLATVVPAWPAASLTQPATSLTQPAGTAQALDAQSAPGKATPEARSA